MYCSLFIPIPNQSMMQMKSQFSSPPQPTSTRIPPFIFPFTPHHIQFHPLNLILPNRSLNSRLQRLRVRTHDLIQLLSVLEDEECGHGADTEFLRYVGDLVYVELDEVCAGEVI
jgi:hypothetical protein